MIGSPSCLFLCSLLCIVFVRVCACLSGYGQSTNGETDFINASNCNLKYDPKNLNPPIVFDVPLPLPAAAAAATTAAAASSSSSSSAAQSVAV